MTTTTTSPQAVQIQVKVKKLPHFKGELPIYESTGASGFDIQAQIASAQLKVKPLERVLVPTGLIFEIPNGFEFQVRSRSGLSFKTGLVVANSPGTIDSDYRGELKIIMINFSTTDVLIEDQQRVAQIVLCPVFKANLKWTETLNSTNRGHKGFGSTGK